MSKAMQGPEVRGEPGRLLDSIYGPLNIGSLSPPTARKHKDGVITPGVILQDFPGCLIQGYGLILAAFGLPDCDKSPAKIYIGPLKPEKLPPPHASAEGQAHKVSGLEIIILVYGFHQGRQLLR